MPSYSLEGIVLKTRNLAEADKVITVFSREFGKRDLIAKGARKIKSRKSPYIDLGSINKMFVVETKSIDIVSEVENKYFPEKIYGDLKRTSTLCIVLEATDKLFKENEEQEYIFDLLRETVKEIDSLDTNSVSTIYIEKILHHAGFIGNLKSCPECSKDFTANDEFTISLMDGSLTHKSCSKGESVMRSVGADELKVLKFYQQNSLHKCARLNLDEKLVKKIQSLIDLYWEINVGYDIKSERINYASMG